MELDHLAQFLHVVDSGSVSAASKLSHLTQPAVSRNLKLLEDAVGAPLFERQGRGLVLTPAGRALVPRARAVLQDVAAATRTVRRAAERGYTDLRFGAVDSVASYLVPRLLAPVRAAFPDLNWKVRTARSAALLEQVDNGTLDFAVVASSGPPKAERAFHLAAYTLQFYGRADRFGALASVTSDEALKQFPIVEIESLAGQPTMIDAEAPAYAIAHSLASVKAFVLAGFGIGAMLPFMLEPQELAQLVRADLPADPHCGLWAVCGQERVHGRARELEQLLIHELGRLAHPAKLQLRVEPMTSADLPEILALNAAHVPHLGAVDGPALAELWRTSELAAVTRDAKGITGFVLALTPDAPYASPNFRWFCERGGRFLYVDRIAVASRCHGQGIGRALYAAVFDAARRNGFSTVTCEVNTLPANPDSLAFHARLGFERVGDLVHVPGEKAVAMLEAGVHAGAP